MPPLVPATVNAGVLVAVATEINPPVKLTLVTVPAPAGVPQVPSPRQNVLADALVPLFRLVTGRLPVTPVVRGKPVAFVSIPDAGVPSAGATNVLLLIVWALVLKVNSSTTLAKSGIVRVVAPTVWEVRAIDTNCPLVSSSGDAAEVARLVALATPNTGVTNVGLVSTTNLVPVPVCEAIDVAFPTLVIGPVKLAFVASFPLSF
jgi:hypothetical protein